MGIKTSLKYTKISFCLEKYIENPNLLSTFKDNDKKAIISTIMMTATFIQYRRYKFGPVAVLWQMAIGSWRTTSGPKSVKGRPCFGRHFVNIALICVQFWL